MDRNFLLYLLLVAYHWTAGAAVEGSNLSPESFSELDLSQYTVRYLKGEDGGQDTEECLQSQPFPLPPGSCQQRAPTPAITPCKSIGYSLLGSCLNQSHMTGCRANITENLAILTGNLAILVYPGKYQYGIQTTIELFGYKNLVIRRLPACSEEVVFSCSSFTDMYYNNLFVVNSVNLSIDGIVFSDCGPKSPGAAIRNVSNAILSNCIFRNNMNSGFVAYSSYDMTFRNCIFRDNNSTLEYDEKDTLNPGSYRYAGGLTLLWNDRPLQPVTTLIRNCTFINNTASINDRNADDSSIRPNFYIPRGHGGAILVSFNGTNYHTVLIEDSIIVNNAARFNGGGLFISFYNESNHNRVIINRTLLDGNRCNNAGGGISMNTFEVANFNRLIVENSNFTSNRAGVGGGACTINHQDNLISTPELLMDNVGVFCNCIFSNNSSPTGGSTVSMVSNTRVDQASTPTTFTNCQFLYNLGSDGTVLGFRFPITLKGVSIFRGNQGGGISLLQSQLNCFGQILFEENNSTKYGGAMDLMDLSIIQLSNNTSITFINNTAFRGGAISVRSSSIGIDSDIIRLFNTRCFLQYEVEVTLPSLPPSEWNVNLTFINNTATIDGAAIYATDIERCTFAPSLNQSALAITYERSIFKLSIFNFKGNTVRRQGREVQELEVSSAPSWFIAEPKAIQGAPGEIVPLGIGTVDANNNWKDAIYSISNGNDEVEVSGEYFSLMAGRQMYYHRICGSSTDGSCLPESKRKLRFSIIQISSGSVRNMTEVKVNVSHCHPGYSQEGDECLSNRTDLILRSDDLNHYVYIQPQFYAEYDKTVHEGIIIYAVIPIPFHKCNQIDNTLSGCLFKYDNPEEQCAESRSGFLCGKCPEGEGVDLTLIQCRKCSLRDTLLVAFIVILFVVGCALILVFNIGIPNELRGCLFFIQVVGFVYQYRTGDTHATWDFHLSRLFGSSLYLPLCPVPGTNALFTTSYELILPVLAIITIMVYIISARFIKHLSNKNSFDGIWFLTFVIYKFIADTCFSILRCQKVVRNDGDVHGEFVYYYDGTFKCFTTADPKHLYFAITALILGTIVMLFPAAVLLISFKRFKLSQQLTDVLNKDLKVSCRWWGSFDLFRRLLFILVVLIFNYTLPLYSQLALLFAGILVFFTFACSKPYNSMKANIIEAFVLLDLLLLTALFLNTNRQNQNSVKPFATALLLLPFIGIGFYILVKLFSYAWRRWCPFTMQNIYSRSREKIHSRVSWKRHLISYESELTDIPDEFNTAVDSVEIGSGYSEFREELLEDSL